MLLINAYAWKDQHFARSSSKSDNLYVHESSQGSYIWLIVSGLGKVYHYIKFIQIIIETWEHLGGYRRMWVFQNFPGIFKMVETMLLLCG